MPIATKATSSNSASVMKPAVSTTMPVASRPTQKVVARRNRRLRPGIARPAATVARNDSPRPLAMTSCITALTGMGTSPTAVRCSPAETTDPRKARDARRPMPAGRASERNTPYAARKNPEKMTTELNVRPDRSEWVPSCEK